MRSVGGVLLGLVLGAIVIVCVELLAHTMYAPATPVNPRDKVAVAAMMAAMPLPAFLLVLTAYLGGTLVGTYTAARVGRGIIPGIIVGVLFFLGAAYNLVTVPHPVWFSVACVVVFVVATMLGTRLGSPMTAKAAA